MGHSFTRDFRRMPIEFRRLRQVAIPDLVALFNHPDVRRHLPLARGTFTPETCERFVAAKERLWTEHGYGPWAFFVDGAFAGWGGLQPEGEDADFGLVLHPRHWGLGPVLCREILRRAFQEMGLVSVIVLLPPTRTRVRALFRLGFRPDGEIEVGGEPFLRYRLVNPELDLNGPPDRFPDPAPELVRESGDPGAPSQSSRPNRSRASRSSPSR